jgi:hypothetical protein
MDNVKRQKFLSIHTKKNVQNKLKSIEEFQILLSNCMQKVKNKKKQTKFLSIIIKVLSLNHYRQFSETLLILTS